MTAVLLVLLLLLVVLIGLFVAAESGLVRSRKGRLEAMAKEGERGAEQALDQVDHLSEYIAACQVGITLCSIGIGFLGEPSLAKLLEPVFGGFSHAVAATIAVTLAFIFVTSIHISFGELVPKLLAIAHTEGAARRLARPLGAFRVISSPFALALTGVATRVVRLFGVRADSLGEDQAPPHTPPPRPPLHGRGPRRSDRAGRARRADRPRDGAAGRSAPGPPAAADLDRRCRRRVRSHGRDRHRGGHPRGGGGGD